MKTMQKGFTLIELMIVVAIIAILAAIAIPQYQNYITKAQFSESQTIADGLKTPIVEYYNQTGICPTNASGSAAASSGGMSLPGSYSGKYVASAATSTGAAAGSCTIQIDFKTTTGSVSTPLLNKSVIITGTNNGGSFSWICNQGGVSTIAVQYMPQACVGN